MEQDRGTVGLIRPSGMDQQPRTLRTDELPLLAPLTAEANEPEHYGEADQDGADTVQFRFGPSSQPPPEDWEDRCERNQERS